MGAILRRGCLTAAQSQPGFVDQGSRLERMADGFIRHLLRGQFAQFLIDQRQQLIRSVGVTLLHTVEDGGDFAHCSGRRSHSGAVAKWLFSAIESRRGFQCRAANHPLRVRLGLKMVAFAHVNARKGA